MSIPAAGITWERRAPLKWLCIVPVIVGAIIANGTFLPRLLRKESTWRIQRVQYQLGLLQIRYYASGISPHLSIAQDSVLCHKRLHIIQIKSTLLTNGLNRGNVMLALEFGAFGIFIEVVNLIV